MSERLMKNNQWSLEKDAMLVRLINDGGLSAQQIADKMTEDGHKTSRYAVIGRSRRLNLRLTYVRPVSDKPKKKPKAKVEKNKPMAAVKVDLFKGDGLKPFAERQSDECSWLYDNNTCCARHVYGNLSWCENHAESVYQGQGWR